MCTVVSFAKIKSTYWHYICNRCSKCFYRETECFGQCPSSASEDIWGQTNLQLVYLGLGPHESCSGNTGQGTRGGWHRQSTHWHIFGTQGRNRTAQRKWCGDVSREVSGDISEDVSGNICGYVSGVISGDVSGDITRDVSGEVRGDMSGYVSRDMSEDISLLEIWVEKWMEILVEMWVELWVE